MGTSAVRTIFFRSILFICILFQPLVAADVAVAQQDQNKAVIDQINKLTGVLTDDLAKDGDFKNSLKALRDRIFAIDCDLDPDKRIQCRVDALVEWLNTISSTSLNADQQKALAAPLKNALDEMAKLERLDPPTALKNEAARLIETLGKISAIDPKATDLVKAITDLGAALKGLQPGNPRINVLGAWYGDVLDIIETLHRHGVREPNVGLRFCHATPAVRTYCQGKYECFNQPLDGTAEQVTLKKATNGDIDNITGPNLCGYEPVPYADPQTKGLVIVYQCLLADDVEWQSLSEISPSFLVWPDFPGGVFNPKDWKYGSRFDTKPPLRPDEAIGVIVRKGAPTDIRCYRKVLGK